MGSDGAPGFADSLAAALDAGEVACVQLRLKEAGDDDIRRAADALAPVARSRDVAFLMNDRPDLARKTGCDGVHIGDDDAPYAEARGIVGEEAIVGVTCKDSYHRAMEAAEEGADYVAFGAYFPTATKQTTSRARLDLLEVWQSIATVPCVAIGGITAGNCGPVASAGADFLAVSSGVWTHPDGPAQAVRAYEAAIRNALAGL